MNIDSSVKAKRMIVEIFPLPVRTFIFYQIIWRRQKSALIHIDSKIVGFTNSGLGSYFNHWLPEKMHDALPTI